MADEEKKDQKKIIVDEDWKKQAQAEKQKQAEEEKKKEGGAAEGGLAEGEQAGGEEQAAGQKRELPKGDFTGLVNMLVTQAFFALGLLEVEGQKREPDLPVAKYNIEMLEALKEKTSGNLSDEEEKAITNTIHQLRMAYVQVSGNQGG